MNKRALFAWFRRSAASDYHDAELGRRTWRAETESWLSVPVPTEPRFYLEIVRRKWSPAPTEDCLHVARAIMKAPGVLERQVHTLLVYEAERRPEALRAPILALMVERVTLQSESQRVSGDIVLRGEPPLTNWTVWHVNGVPSMVTQHWE